MKWLHKFVREIVIRQQEDSQTKLFVIIKVIEQLAMEAKMQLEKVWSNCILFHEYLTKRKADDAASHAAQANIHTTQPQANTASPQPSDDVAMEEQDLHDDPADEIEKKLKGLISLVRGSPYVHHCRKRAILLRNGAQRPASIIPRTD